MRQLQHRYKGLNFIEYFSWKMLYFDDVDMSTLPLLPLKLSSPACECMLKRVTTKSNEKKSSTILNSWTLLQLSMLHGSTVGSDAKLNVYEYPTIYMRYIGNWTVPFVFLVLSIFCENRIRCNKNNRMEFYCWCFSHQFPFVECPTVWRFVVSWLDAISIKHNRLQNSI